MTSVIDYIIKKVKEYNFESHSRSLLRPWTFRLQHLEKLNYQLIHLIEFIPGTIGSFASHGAASKFVFLKQDRNFPMKITRLSIIERNNWLKFKANWNFD